MATQAEGAAALVKVNQVLVKVASETEALLAEIKKLEDALAAAAPGTLDPALEAAIKATAARAHAIDELVADVKPPEGV